MKLFTNLFLVILTCLMTMTISRAELIDNSSIRYTETQTRSVIFSVSKEHAVFVIEPQVKFHWKLAQYKNEEVRTRLTPYVQDHTRYAIQHIAIVADKNIKVDATYVGYPDNLPEGLMFVSDVRYKDGWRWKKVRVAFVIPAVSGFTADEIIYAIYPNN